MRMMRDLFRIAVPLTVAILTVSTLGGLQGNLHAETAQARTLQVTLNSMEVWCDATIISGNINVPAPYVRLRVSTSTPITTLAEVVIPVQPDGSFTAAAYYPLQPTNSHLVGFYTDWDGSQGQNGTMWGADCKAPTGKPTLVSPAHASTTSDMTPTFRWRNMVAARGFYWELQVDDNGAFSSPQMFKVPAAESAYTMSTPLADGPHHWRVRLRSSTFAFSTSWSYAWEVTVKTAPQLLSPADGLTTNDMTPSFDWSDAADLADTAYYILVVQRPTYAHSFYINTGSTYTFDRPLPDDTYTWLVCLQDRANTVHDWGEIRTLTINAAPVLLLPADGSTTDDATPTFDWEDVGDAADVSFYELQVADTADFSSPQTFTGATSTYTIETPLADGSYYWRARVQDTEGVYHNWSETRTLTVDAVSEPLVIQSHQFWPDVQVLDRYATVDFGSRIDFTSTIITRAYLLGFFTYQGEEVPGESICMGRAMPGRGSEVFWSTGTATELAPGVNSFEQNFTYDHSAPDDATHLIMWLMFMDAGDEMLACWQKVIELSPVSP